jgi:hypothetical protein
MIKYADFMQFYWNLTNWSFNIFQHSYGKGLVYS